MQIENASDETIVLRPGECVSGDSTIRSFDGSTSRVVMDRVNKGPANASEFITPVERHMEQYED